MMLPKVLNKSIIFALLLMLSGSQIAFAKTKVYQYDGDLPFVQMMLNMMVAMGILDRLPSNSYGSYGNYSSPWSGYSNNPLTRSPWSRSPWTQSNLNSGAGAVSPIWGSPDWGVLPVEGYGYNGYSPYGSRWSSTDLRGWVDEPWEKSEWNSKAESKTQSQAQAQVLAQPQVQPQPAQPVTPIVQNFNYTVADSGRNSENKNSRQPGSQKQGGQRQGSQRSGNPSDRPDDRQNNNNLNKQSPLAKLPHQKNRLKSQSSFRNKTDQRFRYEKPCITEFCGLKKPNLNGLWVAQDGEVLGVKSNRYLWSDGDSRYLTGQIKIQNEYLLANVDGHEKLMRLKYKLAGNHLLTLQPDGKIREFVRMSQSDYMNNYMGNYMSQYAGQYPAYGQRGQSYGRPNNQPSGRENENYYR